MKVTDVEYRIYSQNGEDGILQHLIKQLPYCKKFFIEIGSGNGSENNTSYLARLGWTGIAIDGKPERVDQYRKRHLKGVKSLCQKVSTENVLDLNLPKYPDVFSLDIDSTDYHVTKALIEDGFRPSIMVLEYNAAFHLWPITVPRKIKKLDRNRYFGCGVMAWRKLLEPIGYKFVTVDSSGTNAFFTLHGDGGIEGIEWTDCKRLAELDGDHTKRFEAIRHLPLEAV